LSKTIAGSLPILLPSVPVSIEFFGMLSTRAPLFSVSLAFATGCVVGLDGVLNLPVALGLILICGVAWLLLGRVSSASLAAFYLFVVSAGIVHTLLLASTISPTDLRRLPEEKNSGTTQWRGVIIEEPASQFTVHATRRTLDRTSFVFQVEAWRPADGRLFGAELDSPWQPATGNIRCVASGLVKDLQCGDRLEFAAALDPVAPSLCPGDFDDRDYEARQGIYYHTTIAAQDWHRVDTGSGRISHSAQGTGPTRGSRSALRTIRAWPIFSPGC
jgi:hypothetical protein